MHNQYHTNDKTQPVRGARQLQPVLSPYAPNAALLSRAALRRLVAEMID